jgi:TRAP-type uncharacterized transport system substrate-binding protein
MANIDQTEATALLNASLKNTAYTPATSWFIALGTSGGTVPTGTALATELAGYTRPAVAFNTASAGSTANTSTVSISSMPVGTVRYIEIYTAATGTTRRLWYGQLTADKTTASGDILSFNAGAITISLG